MKIRNGFVSNSSSSSFLLVYDRDNSVISGAENIVNYIKEHPNEELYLYGGDLSDGVDFFLLEGEMKREILSYPESFIKKNKEVVRSHYDEETSTFKDISYPLQALKGSSLLYMDDLFISDDTAYEEIDGVKLTEEEAKRVKELKHLYENPVVKQLYIDNCVTGGYSYDASFKQRYIVGADDFLYNEYNDFNDPIPKPYIVAYEEKFTKNEDILEELKKESNGILCWFADDFIDSETNAVDITYFKVTKSLAKNILEQKDKFLKNKHSKVFYREGELFYKDNVQVGNKKIDIRYGCSSLLKKIDNKETLNLYFLDND